MKNAIAIFCGILLLAMLATFVGAITSDEVTALVEQTTKAIEENAQETFSKITGGEHPYKDKDNPALYVFVFDTDLNVVAHGAKAKAVGKNMKGKSDVKGKMYPDEFLTVARSDGSGWVDYYFDNPKTKQVEHKTSFIKLVKGSDGKEYIVGSGKYFDE
jgi:polar amino acid transport system substrate-binding protein